MASPMRNEIDPPVKPPRPPNSWILYRKHVLKNLPPPGPGEPRRSQSTVSALVSQMWRNETEETKAFFERLAEEAKNLHKIQFPNYRYQPKKKEDKDRIKEIQKEAKEKERLEKKTRRVGQRNGTAASTSHATLAPSAPYYNVHMVYGAAGPSPPLSASSSPSDATSSPALASIDPLSPTASSAPSSSSLPILVLPTLSYPSTSTLPYPLASSPPALVESLQVANDTSAWQFEDHPQHPENLYPAVDPAADNWDNSILGSTREQPVSSGSVLFDLPQDQVPWLEENAHIYCNFPPPHQGNAVYQLDNFDPSILSQDPQGEVEVSLGSQPQLHDQAFFESLFPVNNDFLTSTIPFDSEQQQLSNMTGNDFTNLSTHDFTNMFLDFQEQSYPTTEASSSALQDFAPSSSYLPPTPTSASQQPIASSSYIPPAGAAHSSTRRVGGNWAKSIYAQERLMGQSPPVQAA